MFDTVYAMAPAGGEATGGGNWTLIIWLVAMVLFFYFLMIRPQKKKEKQDREMRSNLHPGDQITTIGGFKGRVLSVKDDTVTFETGPDRIKLTISKYAISTKESAESKEEAKKEPEKKEPEKKAEE